MPGRHIQPLFVTPENKDNNWLLFEAGAIAKGVPEQDIIVEVLATVRDLDQRMRGQTARRGMVENRAANINRMLGIKSSALANVIAQAGFVKGITLDSDFQPDDGIP